MSHLKLDWGHKYQELDLRTRFLKTSLNTAELFPRVQHFRGYVEQGFLFKSALKVKILLILWVLPISTSFGLWSVVSSTNQSLQLSSSLFPLGFWNATSKTRFRGRRWWWNPLEHGGLGMDILRRITPNPTSWSTPSTHKPTEPSWGTNFLSEYLFYWSPSISRNGLGICCSVRNWFSITGVGKIHRNSCCMDIPCGYLGNLLLPTSVQCLGLNCPSCHHDSL